MEIIRLSIDSCLTVNLGKSGENLARKIIFEDPAEWAKDYGPGTAQLLHQRPGEDTPYPVVIAAEADGSYSWAVTAADTALAGQGKCELQYLSGDTVVKSRTWSTVVNDALVEPSEAPPEAQQGWVDQVLQAGTDAQEAADRAEAAALRQPYPNEETGTWWVWDAEAGAYKDTGISYGGSGGGTSDHRKLTNRNAADQHPMSAITGLEAALEGKQPTGDYLTAETDPTVPAWAKEAQKPSYTASEVGADPSGTAEAKVAAHNTGTDTHSDIRLLIQGLTDRLNALADSDDTTLDQLSEVVAYIKANRDLISSITTDKVSVADIIDNLTTNVANKPLSAAQGVALKALIDAISVPDKLPNPNALTFTGAVEGSYDGSEAKTINIPSGGGNSDGWEKIGEIALESTIFIISAYADGVLTVSSTDGVYPQTGQNMVLRNQDYSGHINARLIATDVEGQYTMVNLDGATYAPSDDLTQYVIDIPKQSSLEFSNISGYQYFRARFTSPLLASHSARKTIESPYKPFDFLDGNFYGIAGGPVEIILETMPSPITDKIYSTACFKRKNPGGTSVFDTIRLFDRPSNPSTIKFIHYSGLFIGGTKIELWGKA